MRCLGCVVLAVLGLSGCVSSNTVIKLKPDGSGTVEVTNGMGAETIAQLKAMLAEAQKEMGGGNQPPKDTEFFKEDEAKAKAAEMGEGVTFVSAEKVKTDAMEGLKATYAFTDINKLKLSQRPSKPKGPGPDAPANPNEPKEELAFKLAKLPNGNAQLTVTFPKQDPAKKKEKEGAGEKPPEQEPDPQELEQMKMIFKGMKIGVAVEVQDKLVKTNSAHVDGNKVTLFEMDFAALVDDAAALKSFAKKQPDTLEETKALLKDLKGFKVNLENEVTIEFSGK